MEQDEVIKLEDVAYQMDPSGAAIRVHFKGGDKKACVEMTGDQFENLVRQMVETASVMSVSSSLPPDPIGETHAEPIVSFVTELEGTLHPDSGALSMRFSDTKGQRFQVTLSPNITDMLRAQFVSSAPKVH